MSTPGRGFLENLGQVLLRLGMAWLYASCVSWLFLSYLQLDRYCPGGFIGLAVLSLAFLVCVSLLFWHRYGFLALVALLLIAAAYFYFDYMSYELPDRQFADIFRLARLGQSILDWLVSFGQWAVNGGGPTQLSLPWLALTISALFALLGWVTLGRFSLPGISLIVLGVVWILTADISPLSLSLCVTGAAAAALTTIASHVAGGRKLLGSFRGIVRGRRLVQTLPIALAAVVVALLVTPLVPARWLYSRTINGWVDDVRRQFLPDAPDSMLSDITVLRRAGYYPLGSRLGGPVWQLSDIPELAVSGTTQGLLLKGAVGSEYSGNFWRQDPDGTKFRLGRRETMAEQNRALGSNLPADAGGISAGDWPIDTVSLSIKTLLSDVQVVFYPGWLRDATPPGYFGQLYFRRDSQVLSREQLPAGQPYSVLATIPREGDAQFARLAARLYKTMAAEPIPPEIRTQYLQMPESQVYQENGFITNLSRQITADAPDPFGKALMIARYLRTMGTYNLNVAYPPPSVDFVHWFLQTREGYCVYYASALTMMCRSVGIPARYVEGFYAPPSADAGTERILSGVMAHAWSEIWLSGLGWVALDATPGGGQAALIALYPERVTPSPSPTPTVHPELSRFPEPLPTEPELDQEPPKQSEKEPDKLSIAMIIRRMAFILAMLVLLALIVLLAYGLYWLVEHSHSTQNPATDRQRRLLALFYWRQIEWLGRKRSMGRRPDETPRQFVHRSRQEKREIRVDGFLSGHDISVDVALSGIEQALYGRRAPTDDELASLRAWYGALEGELRRTLWAPAYWAKRLFSAHFPWLPGSVPQRFYATIKGILRSDRKD